LSHRIDGPIPIQVSRMSGRSYLLLPCLHRLILAVCLLSAGPIDPVALAAHHVLTPAEDSDDGPTEENGVEPGKLNSLHAPASPPRHRNARVPAPPGQSILPPDPVSRSVRTLKLTSLTTSALSQSSPILRC
jgi:hypothetical protein